MKLLRVAGLVSFVLPLVAFTTGCGDSESDVIDEGQLKLEECGFWDSGEIPADPLTRKSAECVFGCVVEHDSCDEGKTLFCSGPEYLDRDDPLGECLFGCVTYECDDGYVVPIEYQCDGQQDCSDGEDEDGCDSSSSFECNDGYVIPAYWRCDTEEDCSDGEDEDGCKDSDFFVCDDGDRIPAGWECDFERDCVDGSDERSYCAQLDCSP